RVYVLGVLAHDHDVDVQRPFPLERRESLVIQNDRTKVDVEVQALTESEDDLAFHDAARRARVADRSEEDGLVFAQRLDVGPRDVRARLDITRRGPGIFLARW